MKKIFLLAIVPLLSVSLLSGCKQKNRDLEQLQTFVEKLNEQPARTLGNGTLLQRCEYKEGDSLLTYRIKVDDERFVKVPIDTLKNAMAKQLVSPSMQKLVKILLRNSVGIQYIFETDGNEMTIVFPPSELTKYKNQ